MALARFTHPQPSLHEATFPLLHPRVVLLVRSVDQRVRLLVLLDVLLHAKNKKEVIALLTGVEFYVLPNLL